MKKMEKSRSFSFKSTKCLVFSSTLSFSFLLICSLFSWLMVRDDTLTYFEIGKKPSVHLLSSNFSGHPLNTSNLEGTLFRKPRNSSGFAEILKNEQGTVDLEEDDSSAESPDFEEGDEGSSTGVGEGYSGNFTPGEENGLTAMGEGFSGNFTPGEENGLAAMGEGYSGNFTPGEENGVKKMKRVCDVSRGRWVYDEGYPLYTNVNCPFIDEGFNCKGNGRLDSDYLKWRWQPQDCDIPRFNATKMLEMIRGKRLVFVGDSINRNQWESMLCLLMGAVKDPTKVYETHGRRITKKRGNYSFKFADYQCTVEYYVTHYMVHEGKARVGQKRATTLRIDSIDRGSKRWSGADILIFNTANWWSHSKTRAGTNYYQEGKVVHPKMEVLTAFRRALTTWATWVDRRINRHRTQVFFRSSAPSHFRGGEWNSGGHCGEAKKPLNKSLMVDSEKDRIVSEVIQEMKTPVVFLNVTSLSGYRIEGHPSIYGSRSKRLVQDCSHWCLPGIPDTWNELLYYHLLSEQPNSSLSR